MRALHKLAVALVGVALVAAGCVGGDDPEQDLPCEFYFEQRETGVDVTIPAECEPDGSEGSGAEGSAVTTFMHVHGLEVPAWAPDGVFLSTHEGLIRIDAEGEWRHVSEERHDFMGFSAHPSEENVLFSSGHPAPGSALVNPLGFMVSTDGGRTWTVQALEGRADFHAMAVGGDGQAVYGWTSAGDAGLHRSVDGGQAWERVPASDLEGAGGAIALAVHPTGGDEVWAGTQAGLMRSRDGGRSWETVAGEIPVTAVSIDPADPDRMLAYAPSPGEGLLESTDGGATWSPLGWVLDDDAVGHLAVHPADPGLLYAGTFNASLYRSDDGGRTWETLARAGERVAA